MDKKKKYVRISPLPIGKEEDGTNHAISWIQTCPDAMPWSCALESKRSKNGQYPLQIGQQLTKGSYFMQRGCAINGVNSLGVYDDGMQLNDDDSWTDYEDVERNHQDSTPSSGRNPIFWTIVALFCAFTCGLMYYYYSYNDNYNADGWCSCKCDDLLAIDLFREWKQIVKSNGRKL